MRRKLSETKRFCLSRSSRPGSVTSLIRLQTAISTGSIEDDAGTWKTWNIKRPWDRSDLFYRGERGAGLSRRRCPHSCGHSCESPPVAPKARAARTHSGPSLPARRTRATLVTAESHGGAPRVTSPNCLLELANLQAPFRGVSASSPNVPRVVFQPVVPQPGEKLPPAGHPAAVRLLRSDVIPHIVRSGTALRECAVPGLPAEAFACQIGRASCKERV